MHDHANSGLPSGWEWCTIEDIAEFLDYMRVPVSARDRKVRISGKSVSDLFPYYGANGRVGWIDDYIFDEELLLLAEDGGHFGDKGRSIAYVIQGKSWVNNHAHVLRPKQGIDIWYLHWVLNHVDVMPYVHGTTRLKLNQSNAKKIPIPLPPTTEQEYIAKKINSVFAESKTERESLSKVLFLLKKFQQSLLVRAFKGELTERDPTDEPAEVLLERISHKRPRKKQVRDFTKKIRSTFLHLPQLPETWMWATIDQLATFIGSGTTPKGGKKVYAKEGIYFIRSQNVHPNGIHLENIAYITPQMHDQMKRTKVYQNDVLLNITGASIGRSAPVPKGFSEANVNQHVCIIRTGWWIVPTYLSYFLNSKHGRDQIFAAESGITREGLNYTQVRNLLVPLAPLNEQKRLVAKVGDAFSLVKQVETEVEKAIARANMIDQSILAKAFRGEIVQQNPEDEPASTILRRIEMINKQTSVRAGRRKRKKVHALNITLRKPIKPTESLRTLLEEIGQTTVEQALQASGLSINDFWDKLKIEIEAGHVERIQKGNSIFLRLKT
jgi:type I restriction enzyme S subunit